MDSNRRSQGSHRTTFPSWREYDLQFVKCKSLLTLPRQGVSLEKVSGDSDFLMVKKQMQCRVCGRPHLFLKTNA